MRNPTPLLLASALVLFLSPPFLAQVQASEATAAPITPCDQYVAWVCEQAGEATDTCRAARLLTGLLPAAACEAALADRAGATAELAALKEACVSLITRLCADLGPETPACFNAQARSATLAPEQCRALWRDYATVLADIRLEAARQAPLSPELQARLRAQDAPSFGPANAPVSLVVFSDFQCPYCVEASRTAAAVYTQFGERIHYVFRHFPLAMHPQAELAARASVVAQSRGLFWSFHDAAFTHPDELDRIGIARRAGELGVDSTTFLAETDGPLPAARVAEDVELARQALVDGTPTLFLNGLRLPNANDTKAVLAAVAAALAASAATPETTGTPSPAEAGMTKAPTPTLPN